MSLQTTEGGLEGENALLTNQTHIQAWETFKIVDQAHVWIYHSDYQRLVSRH